MLAAANLKGSFGRLCKSALRLLPVDFNSTELRYFSCSPVECNKWVRRDNKRRQLFNEYESERLRWRVLAKNKLLPVEVTKHARNVLHNEYPRDSSITRIRNRCTITGRPRGVVRQYGISRIKFRELADAGKFPGVTRSSW